MGSVHPHLFINSGMTLDIASILAAPWEPVVFAVLMLVIRGLAGAVHVPGRAHHQPALADGLLHGNGPAAARRPVPGGAGGGYHDRRRCRDAGGRQVVSVMLFPQIAAAIGRRSNAQAQPADADDVAPPSLRPKPDRRSGMANEAYIYEAIRTPAAGARPTVRCTGSSP